MRRMLTWGIRGWWREWHGSRSREAGSWQKPVKALVSAPLPASIPACKSFYSLLSTVVWPFSYLPPHSRPSIITESWFKHQYDTWFTNKSYYYQFLTAFYQKGIPFLWILGRRPGISALDSQFLHTHSAWTSRRYLRRSVLDMPSNPFKWSLEGVSSLSNQYQNLILVTCFEVTDFTFSIGWKTMCWSSPSVSIGYKGS